MCTLFLSVLQNNLISRFWRYSLFLIQYLTDFSKRPRHFSTLRPIRNGRHFSDDIIKCIFVYENAWIPIKISLKFVPEGPIDNIPALVRIMAWRRPGDKPLSEPMMVRSPTHICVTRPQWVKIRWPVRIPWKLTGYSAAVRAASLSCFVVISSFLCRDLVQSHNIMISYLNDNGSISASVTSYIDIPGPLFTKL